MIDTDKSVNKAIEDSMMQLYLKRLRSKRYYVWVKKIKGGLCLQANKELFAMQSTRYLMALDYRKLYDAVLFEIFIHMSRACFCKLAKCFKLSIDPEILDYDLSLVQSRLTAIFNNNIGLEHEAQLAETFRSAYRSALLDIHLYFNVDLNVMEEPRFSCMDLINTQTSIKTIH